MAGQLTSWKPKTGGEDLEEQNIEIGMHDPQLVYSGQFQQRTP
jgi:hypothetical protein